MFNNSAGTDLINAKNTFDSFMNLTNEDLDTKTNALVSSILNTHSDEDPNIMRELVTIANRRKNSDHAATLQRFIPPPTPNDFNTTIDENLLNNAQKNTEHHTLYKNMTSLSATEKAQLIEKFGITLTKFAVSNLILLYIEGNKINPAKGMRNTVAVVRQIINSVFSTPNRNVKLEFFAHLLKELNNPLPFSGYENSQHSFVSDTRKISQYSHVKGLDDKAYWELIKDGTNTNNALTLFDRRTLQILENTLISNVYTQKTTQTMYTSGEKTASNTNIKNQL